MATLVVHQLRGRLSFQGARLRRSPEGGIAGHRDRERRQGEHRDFGVKLENVKLDMLGRAKSVTIEKESTTIAGGAGKKRGPRSGDKPDQGTDRGNEVRLRPRETARAARNTNGRRCGAPRQRHD